MFLRSLYVTQMLRLHDNCDHKQLNEHLAHIDHAYKHIPLSSMIQMIIGVNKNLLNALFTQKHYFNRHLLTQGTIRHYRFA